MYQPWMLNQLVHLHPHRQLDTILLLMMPKMQRMQMFAKDCALGDAKGLQWLQRVCNGCTFRCPGPCGCKACAPGGKIKDADKFTKEETTVILAKGELADWWRDTLLAEEAAKEFCAFMFRNGYFEC